MALLPPLAALLLLFMTLTCVHLSDCHIVKGSVSCPGCSTTSLSGVRVAVKCRQEKKLGYAVTDEDGRFEADIPPSPNCVAMLLGGNRQLYAPKKTKVSKIVKDKDSNSYTISTPLTFYTTCSSNTCITSSKTIDIPFPPEWGLPPTSYFLPFIPIIGIP